MSETITAEEYRKEVIKALFGVARDPQTPQRTVRVSKRLWNKLAILKRDLQLAVRLMREGRAENNDWKVEYGLKLAKATAENLKKQLEEEITPGVYCVRCGRKLSNKTSIKYEMGPVCRKYRGVSALKEQKERMKALL